MSDREFDVIVFGATGVTGRQVASYLAERAPEVGARWAAAGRDRERVTRAVAGAPRAPDAVVAADVSDPASLMEMARRTRVVLNLVGPYTRLGLPVVEACVSAGAHYVDLTGEMPFVVEVLRRLNESAREAGVKLVQICGFEALPPDLAVALAAEHSDGPLTELDLEVAVWRRGGLPRPSDGVSGGTIQSLVEALGADRAEVIADPAALIEDPVAAEAVRARSPLAFSTRRRGTTVIAPMAPAGFINPAIIHRSAALLAAERAEPLAPFRYREGVTLPGSAATLPARLALAALLAGSQHAALAGARLRPAVRRRISAALRTALPKSGFGPAEARLGDWSWRMTAHGRAATGSSVHVRIDGDGHPGYLTAARAVGEAGLMLAADGATPERAGSLTPALALGTGAAERLARAGLRFSVMDG